MAINVENQPKKLKATDLFLGIILLMLFLDSGTSSSAMGPSSITWYLILGVIFFLPMALINAELSSTYPSDGGLYHWVKVGLGADNAARTTWYYWLNNAIWVASATIFVMDVICQMLSVLFGVEVSFFLYLAFSCVLTWIYVFLASQPMNESTAIRNLGGIAKLSIVVAMVVCAVCYLIFNDGQPASDLSPSAFVPSMGAALVFFGALIYNVMGFDAICAIGGTKIKDPAKDLPRMMILALIVILVAYILFTLAMCIITPWEEIDIIGGILNCFLFTFEGPLGVVLYVIIGIVFLYTLISSGPAWLQAAGFMAIESAERNELPKIFATTTKKGAPFGSNILIGIVSTVVIVAYGLIASFVGGTASDLFWTLFSFTSFIFLLTFIMCCQTFIKLRKNDAATKRAYRFPGSDGFAIFAARFCQLMLIITLITFFWTPGYAIDWISAGTLGAGIIIGMAFGEYFNMKRKKSLK